LLLAARQLVREMSRSFREPHTVQHLAGDLGRVLPTGSVVSELNVLDRRQCRKQVERLKHEAHPMPAKVEQLTARRPRDVPTRHHHVALTRGVEGADDVQQGRLAATRRAKHHQEVLRRDLQRDICERHHLIRTDAIAAANTGELHQRPRRRLHSRRGRSVRCGHTCHTRNARRA
jgi:hypothetical protein